MKTFKESIDPQTKAYVCIHVFEKTRPVLLVSRTGGGWCLLCGAPHPGDADAYRVVGIGHDLDADPTLSEILDLTAEWDAERERVGGPWTRRLAPEEGSADWD